MNMILPTDSEARKRLPMARGLLDYFPSALAEVSRLSLAATEKHNPGGAMCWARGKSTDHADTLLRHLVDRGTIDPEDGIRHSVKVAWRALALLQEELEVEEGATPGRASKFPEEEGQPCPRVECAVSGQCGSASDFARGYPECLADCNAANEADEPAPVWWADECREADRLLAELGQYPKGEGGKFRTIADRIRALVEAKPVVEEVYFEGTAS